MEVLVDQLIAAIKAGVYYESFLVFKEYMTEHAEASDFNILKPIYRHYMINNQDDYLSWEELIELCDFEKEYKFITDEILKRELFKARLRILIYYMGQSKTNYGDMIIKLVDEYISDSDKSETESLY